MDAASLWLGLVDVAIEAAMRRTLDRSHDALDVQTTAHQLSTHARDERPQHHMTTLAVRFGLSPLEELALWTLVAQQVNPQTASRLAALSGGDAAITLGTLAMVAYGGVTGGAMAALSGPRGVVRLALAELSPATKGRTWSQREVVIADRVLRVAFGAELDVEHAACEAACHDLDVELGSPIAVRAVGELVVEADTLRRAREAMNADSAVVIASAIAGTGRRALLLALAAESGKRVLCFDARQLDRDRERAEQQIRALARECTLGDRLPLIANIDVLRTDSEDRFEWFARELDTRIPGLILATCGLRTPATRWRRPTHIVTFGRSTSQQRARHWAAATHGLGIDAASLAQRYAFAPAIVQRIGDHLAARARHGALDDVAVSATIRAVIEDRLSAYASRIAVTQTWDDLVLAPDQLELVVELYSRISHRDRVYEGWGFGNKIGKGLGVAALFSGPPGTGKTMVASLLAIELGLELYQVDLGKVVSKYIGETEKNLAALFDAAEASCALLLFDEADSLFGKRTEVKSSNDRYANLETNYLLSRLESYSGVCFLTSNHESNIDEAFLRRLSMHLRFDMPELDERERLWNAMIPKAAPVERGIDFRRLATRYVMSGGHIRNAALRAAFIAVEKGTSISEKILDGAARREYEAMGKIA